jgi:hypothetical protein
MSLTPPYIIRRYKEEIMEIRISHYYQNIKGTELESLFPKKIIEEATDLKYLIRSSSSIIGESLFQTDSGKTEIHYFASKNWQIIYANTMTIEELEEFFDITYEIDVSVKGFSLDGFLDNEEMIEYGKKILPDDPVFKDVYEAESNLDFHLQLRWRPNPNIPTYENEYNYNIKKLFRKSVELKPLSDKILSHYIKRSIDELLDTRRSK